MAKADSRETTKAERTNMKPPEMIAVKSYSEMKSIAAEKLSRLFFDVSL
jgi:hypothetical protein